MKFKHVLIAVIIAILMLAAFPKSSPALAHDEKPNLSVSEIVCTVGSEYVFSIPLNATIAYPMLEADIGTLGIDDVFLPSGEWLSVSIVQGALEANGDPSATLLYDVAFNPAAVITETNIGEEYPIVIKVDDQAYESASSGVYEGTMFFKVVLQPYGKVVWIGATSIAITKPNTGGGNDPDDQGDNEEQGDDAQDDIVAPDDEGLQNDNQSITDDEDQGTVEDGIDGVDLDEGTDGEEAIVLGDEGIARAGGQWFAMWWWLIAIIVTLALLLTIFFFVKRRKRDEEQ